MGELVVIEVEKLRQIIRETVAELSPKEIAHTTTIPDLVSEKELARWLNISVQTVRRHRVKKLIPYYDFDGRYFYDRCKVLEVLEKR